MENNPQKVNSEEVKLDENNDIMIMPDETTVNVKGLTQKEKAEIMEQYWENSKSN